MSERRLQSPAGPLTRSSKSYAEDDKAALSEALAAFQAALTDAERTRLQQTKTSFCDADAVIKFTHDLDGLDPARRGKSIATKLYSFLQTIQQFYQVTDTYVSSTPEIAALVWGSVKLTFMVRNFLPKAIDDITDQERCWETSRHTLRSSLIFFMALTNIAHGKQQLLHNLTQSFQAEIRPYVDAIQAKADQVKDEITLAKSQADSNEQAKQAEERREAAESRRRFSRWQIHSQKQFQDVSAGQEAQTKQQNWESLLIKLSSYDHAAAFRKARLRRHNGTAEWVFPTQQFQNWFHSEKSSILHLTGKSRRFLLLQKDEDEIKKLMGVIVGSGKTVLTANVIDHLIAERKSCQLVSFFFVAFNDAASLSAEHIIRCLIRQALDHSSVNDSLIHGLRKAESRFFSNDALMELWAEKVKSVDELFVVLDGLDECSESERELLLGCLAKLGDAVSGEARVKVLLSSRETIVDEVDRSDLSASRLGLSTANIQSDLSKYAEEILMQRVSTKKLKIDNEHLLQEVIREVQRGGEGMFLWVFLTVEDLCTRKSDIEIRNALQTIPRKLSGTFDRALARIVENGHEKVAHDTFRWAAVVRRPLTTDQLREALAIEIGQMHYKPERLINGVDQITAWCENLVQIEETDNTVHFSHHSIRKYLLDPTSQASRSFHIDLQDWDHHVGEVCVTYLNFNDFKAALIRYSRLRLESTIPDHYPAGFASEAVRTALPGTTGARIAKVVHHVVLKSKRHSYTLPKAQKPLSGKAGAGEATIPEHPFLQYAVDEWLFHTTRFSVFRSKTWSLWQTMISGDDAPWMELQWQPPGMCELDYWKWLDHDGNDTDETNNRSLTVVLHKAIVYADFIGHYTLMEQFISMFQSRAIRMHGEMFESFLPLRKSWVYSSGTRMDRAGHRGELTDPHVNFVNLVTEFIAWGGRYWPICQSSFPDRCPDNVAEAPGIHGDVCSMLNDPEGSIDRGLQTLARLAVIDINERFFHELLTPDAQLTRYPLTTRTYYGKTIISVVLEQGGEWPQRLAVWFLQQWNSTWSFYFREKRDFLLRDTLLRVLKNGDWDIAGSVFQASISSSSRLERIDHHLISYATQYKGLPSEHIEGFIRTCIPERSCDLADEMVERNLAIFNTARRRHWEIAVALHRCGARLKPVDDDDSSSLDFKACELLNSVFACIHQMSYCSLDEIEWGRLKPLRLCRRHLNEAQSLKPLLDEDNWRDEAGAKILLSILDQRFVYV